MYCYFEQLLFEQKILFSIKNTKKKSKLLLDRHKLVSHDDMSHRRSFRVLK